MMAEQVKSGAGWEGEFMKELMMPKLRAEMQAEQGMMMEAEARHEKARHAAESVVNSLGAMAPNWLSGCGEQWEAILASVENEVHMDINWGMEPWSESLQAMFMAVMEAQILCQMDRGTTCGNLEEMVGELNPSWLSDGSKEALDRMSGSKSHLSVKLGGVDYLEMSFAISQARKHAHACEGCGQMQDLIAAGRAWRERIALEAVSGSAAISKAGPRM